jgi:hypothetical protein
MSEPMWNMHSSRFAGSVRSENELTVRQMDDQELLSELETLFSDPQFLSQVQLELDLLHAQEQQHRQQQQIYSLIELVPMRRINRRANSGRNLISQTYERNRMRGRRARSEIEAHAIANLCERFRNEGPEVHQILAQMLSAAQEHTHIAFSYYVDQAHILLPYVSPPIAQKIRNQRRIQTQRLG